MRATVVRDRIWDPTSRTWETAWLNLVGSVAFGVSAIAAYTVPESGEVVNAALVNLGTFVGALCFLGGALLMTPDPAHTPQRSAPSPAERGTAPAARPAIAGSSAPRTSPARPPESVARVTASARRRSAAASASTPSALASSRSGRAARTRARSATIAVTARRTRGVLASSGVERAQDRDLARDVGARGAHGRPRACPVLRRRPVVAAAAAGGAERERREGAGERRASPALLRVEARGEASRPGARAAAAPRARPARGARRAAAAASRTPRGISTALLSAPNVRSAAVKRSPVRNGRPSASSAATSSNTASHPFERRRRARVVDAEVAADHGIEQRRRRRAKARCSQRGRAGERPRRHVADDRQRAVVHPQPPVGSQAGVEAGLELRRLDARRPGRVEPVARGRPRVGPAQDRPRLREHRPVAGDEDRARCARRRPGAPSRCARPARAAPRGRRCRRGRAPTAPSRSSG